MITLSERAKILVELAGSLKALAAIAGISSPSISDWLNGKTKSIKGTPAARIARHFDLNPVWVTDGIGSMRSAQQPVIASPPEWQPAELREPSAASYPGAIMVYGEEKLIVLGYRKLSEGMRQIWLQAAKDAVEKEAETTVDRKKRA